MRHGECSVTRDFVGILLAAGQSRRFGKNKLLQPLRDGTPLAVAAGRHLSAVLPQTIAVVDSAQSEAGRLLEGEGLGIVVNPRAAEGVGTSIACGVAASQDARGWVIALADMPYVPETVIQQLVLRLHRGAEIVAPVFGSRRGHPVAFSRKHGQALMRLEADQGARSILAMHPEDLDLIQVQDNGVILDIDHADTLLELEGERSVGP